jgi:hypothetical protein
MTLFTIDSLLNFITLVVNLNVNPKSYLLLSSQPKQTLVTINPSLFQDYHSLLPIATQLNPLIHHLKHLDHLQATPPP